jgi:hypothetical protein
VVSGYGNNQPFSLMSSNQSVGSFIDQSTCYLLISSDFLLLTQNGYNVTDVQANGACVTTIFVYACWLSGQFSAPCEDMSLDEGPNIFSYNSECIMRVSVTRGLTRAHPSRYSRTKSMARFTVIS